MSHIMQLCSLLPQSDVVYLMIALMVMYSLAKEYVYSAIENDTRCPGSSLNLRNEQVNR